jgi:hypothetical protein
MTTGEGDGEKVPYWRETMREAAQSQSISRRTAGTLRAAPGMGWPANEVGSAGRRPKRAGHTHAVLHG